MKLFVRILNKLKTDKRVRMILKLKSDLIEKD